MGKWMNDSGADAALDWWADCDKMILCSAQPSTYAEATVTYALGDVAMVAGNFTKGNGDTSGRKVTVAAKTGVAVDSAGTGTHVALVKSGDTTLRYVTTCAAQAVSAGGTFDVGSWKIEIADPA